MTNAIRHVVAALSMMLLVMLSPLSLAAQPAAAETAVSATVNINTADAATLAQSLNGIGQRKAEAIVEYRTANGPFTSAEDLMEVKGIGAATVEKNAAIIVVE